MRKFFVTLLAVLAVASAAQAQERSTYSQPELDQMLAPIALYPDALLSQVLMASTYPLDVVEAARWMRTHPGLQGDEAVAMVADEDWDPSVKSLVAFPKLLQRMDENLAWTRSVGAAFLEQEPHVMETVQQLRRRAQAAGQLLPDERLRAVTEGGSIVIEQADPRVVYVPYYDPWIVYGAWGWPAYPPVVWSPWTNVAIHVTTGFFFGGIDWHHRHVKVVHVQNHYVRPVRSHVVRPLHVGKWRHVPPQRSQFRRHDERPAYFAPQARPMPPALSASPPIERRARPPRQYERPQRAEPSRRVEAQPHFERPQRAEPSRRVEAQPHFERPQRAEPPRRIEAQRYMERPQRAEPPRRVEAQREPQRAAPPQRHAERNGRRG